MKITFTIYSRFLFCPGAFSSPVAGAAFVLHYLAVMNKKVYVIPIILIYHSKTAGSAASTLTYPPNGWYLS
jgi:hypothetical protein